MATKKSTKKATKKSAKKEQERVKRWSDITGEVRIFGETVEYGKGKKASSFVRYSTSVGIKNEDDDTYKNLYYKVGFAKDVDPENDDEGGFVIHITRGFLTLEEYVIKRTGEVRRVPKLVILDYEEKDELCGATSKNDDDEEDDN